MSLRNQILAAFAVLIVPLALVALVAFATIGQLGGAVDTVLSENERSLQAVAEMDVALERLDSAALYALLGRTDAARTLAATNRPRFEDALAVAAANLTIEGEGEIVREVETAFADFERAFVRLLDPPRATPDGTSEGVADDARAVYATALVPAFERTRDALGTLRTANREAAVAAGEDAGRMAEMALWAVGVGTLIALVLGTWAAFRLARQIAARYE